MEKFPVPKKTLSRIKSKSGALLRAKSNSREKSSSYSIVSSTSQEKGKSRAVDSDSTSRGQSQDDRNAPESSLSKDVSSQARSPNSLSAPPSKRLRSTLHPPTLSPSPPPPNPNILATRSPSPIPISTPPRIRPGSLGATRSFISDQHVFTSPFTFTTKEDKERARAGVIPTEGSADSGLMMKSNSSSSPSNFAQSAHSSPGTGTTSRPVGRASRALRSGLVMTGDVGTFSRRRRRRKKEQGAALPLKDGQNTMCVWRSQGRGEIRITRADFYRTTMDEEYLNDTLIEFGLKESFHRATIRNPGLENRVHIFNSFLYMKLTDPSVLRKGLDPWESVKRWTMGKVDLFEKKYLVVPINENYHWYMAVIVNPQAMIPSTPQSPSLAEQTVKGQKEPRLAQRRKSGYAVRRSTRGREFSDISEVAEENDMGLEKGDEKEGEAAGETTTSKNDNDKLPVRPYVLLFDSFGTSRPQPGHVLTRYLRSEATASGRIKEGADIQPLIHRKADVPTQPDFSSCGVYLLHYADVFFSDPELAVKQVLAQPAKKTAKTRADIESIRDEFWRSTELDKKREEISNRILRVEAEWKASQATNVEQQAKEEATEEEDLGIEEHESPNSGSSSEIVPDSIPVDHTLSSEPEEGSQTIYERMKLAFPSSAVTTMLPGGTDDSASSSIAIDPSSRSRSGDSNLLKPHSSDIEAIKEGLLQPEIQTDTEQLREEEIMLSTLRSHISPTPSPPRPHTSDRHSYPGQPGLDVSLSLSIIKPSSPPSVSSREVHQVDPTEASHSGLKVPVGETTSDFNLTLPSHLSPTPPPPLISPTTTEPENLLIGSVKPHSSEIIPSSVDDQPKFLLGKSDDESNESKLADTHLIERSIPSSLSPAPAPPFMTAAAMQAPYSSTATHSRSIPLALQKEENEASGLRSSLTKRGRGRGRGRRVGGSSEIVTPALRRSTRSTNDRAK